MCDRSQRDGLAVEAFNARLVLKHRNLTNDDAGRVLRKQDAKGDTVTFNYDLAGRLSQRDYRTKVNSPSGTIADSDVFTYDKASRMLTAASGRYSNTVTYTYDTAGRKATEARPFRAKPILPPRAIIVRVS
ncbi:MAG: hypothetical protein R3C53_09320 [Pirellulaceae bacterium]